jgi:oligopeptidase A
LRASAEFARLDRAQKKIVENDLRDFRLGGAELSPDQKAEFKQVREQLDKLSSRFSDNLLDATNAFAHYVTDRSTLTGIPEDVVEAARVAAQQDGKDG